MLLSNALATLGALSTASGFMEARIISLLSPHPYLLRVQTQGRESIAAKLVANLITEAGADRVLACDLHSGQSVGYFDIRWTRSTGRCATALPLVGWQRGPLSVCTTAPAASRFLLWPGCGCRLPSPASPRGVRSG